MSHILSWWFGCPSSPPKGIGHLGSMKSFSGGDWISREITYQLPPWHLCVLSTQTKGRPAPGSKSLGVPGAFHVLAHPETKTSEKPKNPKSRYCTFDPPKTKLVGGWTNPFEKYARQNGKSSPNSGENKKYLKPPVRIVFENAFFTNPCENYAEGKKSKILLMEEILLTSWVW